jgi:cytochrome c553
MKFSLFAAIFVSAAMTPVVLAQSVESVVKGDPTKGQQTASKVCAACHGPDGNSPLPVNPSLAGQHPEYIFKQLVNFTRVGGKPAERANPTMAGMAALLNNAQMKDVAAYYAAQTPRPRSARDKELVMAGQAIYRGGIAAKGVAACASCHSPTGAGMPAQFPRIAGQHAEYSAAQLKAFRSGGRANDLNRMMRNTAGKLTDREIAAVSEYMAGLR